MLIINLSNDLERAVRGLDELGLSQVPYAASLAINACAQHARIRAREEMARVFDRPRPYTLNSIYTINSRKQDLTATVGLKDGKGGRQGAAQYLRAEIAGGLRRATPFEERMAAAFKGKGALIPASGARRDAYGNLQKAMRTAIINAEKNDQGGNPRGIFIIPEGAKSHLPPGIYQRIPIKVKTKKRRGQVVSISGGGTRLKVLMLFEKDGASYTPQFNFEKKVREAVALNFGKEFEKAMIRARFSANKGAGD